MNSKGRPGFKPRSPRETILLRDLAPRADVLGRGTRRIFGEAEDSRNDQRPADEGVRPSTARSDGKKPKR